MVRLSTKTVSLLGSTYVDLGFTVTSEQHCSIWITGRVWWRLQKWSSPSMSSFDTGYWTYFRMFSGARNTLVGKPLCNLSSLFYSELNRSVFIQNELQHANFNLIHQLWSSLADWPSTIEQFERTIALNGNIGNTAIEDAIASLSSDSSAALLVFWTGLVNLVSAVHHTQDANYHKVMVNIKFLVFALCWFGMVCR